LRPAAGVYSASEQALPGPLVSLPALPAHSFVSPGDRLAATAVFAVLAHLIVIFGVTFVRETPPEPLVTTLDVVLVPRSADVPPEQADFLAAANRDGGGNDDERGRPETPSAPPAIVADAPSADNAPATAGPPTPVRPTESTEAGREARRPPGSLTVRASDAPPAPTTALASGRPETTPTQSRRLEMAALSAEIERKLRSRAERPQRKWISARTREDRFAAYMVEWRRKVERVGNLNYPDRAIRLGLSGNLLLEVALNPDGTITDIELRRSSGEPVLDAAAVRIVKLAAPFAPFPPEISRDVDILHIERTWFFHSDHQRMSP